MARLSQNDENRAAEVTAALGELHESAGQVLDRSLPMVRDLLGISNMLSYRVDADALGVRVDWEKSVGFGPPDDHIRASLRGFFTRLNERRANFDPANAQRSQRNRAITMPLQAWCGPGGPEELAEKLLPYAHRLGLRPNRLQDIATTTWQLGTRLGELGISADYQLRMLLCEGRSMLGVIAGVQEEEQFSDRQRLLLQRVGTALREQLIVERRTGGTQGLGHAVMVAALEHVPSAAFIVDEAGRVAYANAVGRHRLEVRGDVIREALSQRARDPSAPRNALTWTKLAGPGLPALYLAVSGSGDDRVRFGIERARRRWQLTPREVDVLAEVAAGRQNSQIAERLDAAPRTIELHISSILRKAHADSRSQLVVDLWHLAGP